MRQRRAPYSKRRSRNSAPSSWSRAAGRFSRRTSPCSMWVSRQRTGLVYGCGSCAMTGTSALLLSVSGLGRASACGHRARSRERLQQFAASCHGEALHLHEGNPRVSYSPQPHERCVGSHKGRGQVHAGRDSDSALACMEESAQMNINPVEISSAQIAETIQLLREAGRQECILLWLGRREHGLQRIIDVYKPVQEADRDYFEIPRQGMAVLMERLRTQGLYVVSQVHTHPELAFHSRADDKWAIVRHAGALSIVLALLCRIHHYREFPAGGGCLSARF